MNLQEAIELYKKQGLSGDQAFQIDDAPGVVGLTQIKPGEVVPIVKPQVGWKIATSTGNTTAASFDLSVNK